jgi:hypothetical protein
VFHNMSLNRELRLGPLPVTFDRRTAEVSVAELTELVVAEYRNRRR